MANDLIFPATGAIEIREKFGKEYNLLIPTKVIQEVSPAHRVMIRLVTISTDYTTDGNGRKQFKDREIYESTDHPGEYELTKKAIDKFKAAANIQIVDSKTVTPSSCQKCVDIARQTSTFPDCQGKSCVFRFDVAYEVTIAIPEGIGAWRLVKATKELSIPEQKKAMKENQFNRFFPHRYSHCESKALNRAVRAGLSLKISYTMEELKKPFAVALMVPNMEDPEIKTAAIQAYFSNCQALFKTAGPVVNPPQLVAPTGEQVTITAITTAEPEQGDPKPAQNSKPQQTNQGQATQNSGQARCSNPQCNKFISKGEVKHSTEKNGRPLCFKCQDLPEFKQPGNQ